MPRPTRQDIINAHCNVMFPAETTRIMDVIDEAWDADEAERERGSRALALIETYGLRHTSSCSSWNFRHAVCDCGAEDARATLREETANEGAADMGAVMRGVSAASPSASLITATETTPEVQAQDRAGWEYAVEEQVDQYNREQRIRREAYASALYAASCSGRKVNARAAAARYPLKKRVPAMVEDPHSPNILWRLQGPDKLDGLRLEWKAKSGHWTHHLGHGSPAVTPQRIRALAALLDSPWTFEDDTSAEGEAT